MQKIQTIFILLCVLMGTIFVFGSLIPYTQMNQYHSIVVNSGAYEGVLEKNFIFNPHTTATDMVCTEIITHISIPVTKTIAEIPAETKAYVPFLKNVLIRCDGSLRASHDPVDRYLLSTIYSYLGHITNEQAYFEESTVLVEEVVRQSPLRQSFVLFQGLNLFFERQFVEAKKYFELFLKTNPDSKQAVFYLNMITNFGIK